MRTDQSWTKAGTSVYVSQLSFDSERALSFSTKDCMGNTEDISPEQSRPAQARVDWQRQSRPVQGKIDQQGAMQSYLAREGPGPRAVWPCGHLNPG